MSLISDNDEKLEKDTSLKRKRKRCGVLERNKLRGTDGEFHNLFPQLREDGEQFYKYFGMDIETFDYILEIAKPRLIKQWCNFHQQMILPEERLALTLR